MLLYAFYVKRSKLGLDPALNIVDRGLIVLFFGLFVVFRSFSISHMIPLMSFSPSIRFVKTSLLLLIIVFLC